MRRFYRAFFFCFGPIWPIWWKLLQEFSLCCFKASFLKSDQIYNFRLFTFSHIMYPVLLENFFETFRVLFSTESCKYSHVIYQVEYETFKISMKVLCYENSQKINLICFDQHPNKSFSIQIKLISFKNNPKPPSDTQNLHDFAP